LDTAEAMAWHPPSIMFARWCGDFIHACRPAMLHEPRMIEAIAAGHVVGVPLGEPVERRTIGMARSGAERAKQRQHRAETDHADHHDARSNHVED